ncbi:uncharacterized protein TNCV_3966331 [Trichonephila clavipes]|nr:uncharacterized protein TNCV_3966331 [Trichonephila clavipes]
MRQPSMAHTCSTDQFKCRPIHTCDILRLKAFAYDVCKGRTGVVIHKHKFYTYGAPRQTYMLFQNDIPMDLASHRSNLNMQVTSGTQNNPPPKQVVCTTKTVSFNDALLLVTGTWRSLKESPLRIRLQAKLVLVGKHY